jgi:hypothetical protein
VHGIVGKQLGTGVVAYLDAHSAVNWRICAPSKMRLVMVRLSLGRVYCAEPFEKFDAKRRANAVSAAGFGSVCAFVGERGDQAVYSVDRADQVDVLAVFDLERRDADEAVALAGDVAPKVSNVSSSASSSSSSSSSAAPSLSSSAAPSLSSSAVNP